jgi:hypothetical protein
LFSQIFTQFSVKLGKNLNDNHFYFQARRQVPDTILKQIISLNSLDMELYEHAKNIFTQEHLIQKGQHPMVVQYKQLADQRVTQEHLMHKGKHPMVVLDKEWADQKVWSSS